MSKVTPRKFALLSMAVWLATSLAFAPTTAVADDTSAISRTDLSPGGGMYSGDPDQPDPTKLGMPTSGLQPRPITGTSRGYLEADSRPSSVSVVGTSARGWLEMLLWSVRFRIGW